MRRLTTALLFALLLLLGLLTATATPAPALPTETGCPSAFQVLSVAELTAQATALSADYHYPNKHVARTARSSIFYQFGDDNLRARY